MVLDIKTSVLITDGAFSYCLSVVKEMLNVNFGYELSLENAEPGTVRPDLHVYWAPITLFLAYTADNCFGKYLLVVYGLFSAFLSTGIVTFEPSTDAAPPIFYFAIFSMAFYVMTSPIRNVLLLEQINLPSEVDSLRNYIFLLMYVRFLGRGFYKLAVLVVPSNILFVINLLLTTFGTFGYFVVFVFYFGKRLYLETIYPHIWAKCLKCFAIALKRTFFNRKQQIPPVVTKSYVKRAREINPIARRVPRKFRACCKTVIISSVNEKYVAGFHDDILKSERTHWVCRARPNSNELVIHQTYRTYRMIPFVFFGACFSSFSYIIIYLSIKEGEVALKSSKGKISSFDILSVFIIMQLLLYPIVEFIMVRYLIKVFTRDIHFFIIGYLVLFLAFGTVAYTQFSFFKIEYFPLELHAQIRIFNGKNQNVSVRHNEDYTIPKYGYRRLTVPIETDAIMIDGNKTNVDIKKEIGKEEVHVKTIVINGKGMRQYDDSNLTSFFKKNIGQGFVYAESEREVNCTFVNEDGDKNTMILTRNLTNIEPDFYSSIMADEATIGQNVTIEASSLHAVFVYESGGKVIKIDDPVPIHYHYLLPQIVFLSIANSIANVSYFRFLFLESPRKLKSTIFSLTLAFDFVFLASFDTFFEIAKIYENYTQKMYTIVIFNTVILFLTCVLAYGFPYIYDPYVQTAKD